MENILIQAITISKGSFKHWVISSVSNNIKI